MDIQGKRACVHPQAHLRPIWLAKFHSCLSSPMGHNPGPGHNMPGNKQIAFLHLTEEEGREESQVSLLNNFNPKADYYLQCLKAQNIPKMYGIV